MIARSFIPAVLAVAALAVVARPAAAQTPQERGYVPVDPRVADLDPLQKSLRVVDDGSGDVPNQRTQVYRAPGRADGSPAAATGDKLFVVQQGVIAEYDRSRYLDFYVKRIGIVTVQDVPANTVFHIGLPKLPSDQDHATPTSPQFVDARIDGRDLRRSLRDLPGAAAPDPAVAWNAYRRALHANRFAVIRAIDRDATD